MARKKQTCSALLERSGRYLVNLTAKNTGTYEGSGLALKQCSLWTLLTLAELVDAVTPWDNVADPAASVEPGES